MTEKISDERLADLQAMQQKRIKGRGSVPDVRDLAKALTELAEYRKQEAKSRKRRYYGLKWSDGMIEQSGDYSYSLEEARANAKREQQSDPDGELPVIVQQIITEHTGPWVEVTDDD